MKMKEKIYLSGKIGGAVVSKATLEKFAKRERFLVHMGFEVFNPTCSGLGSKAEALAKKHGTDFYREILLLDLAELKACDALYLLPDWKDSPGAMAELAFARAIGLKVVVEPERGPKPWNRK